MVPGVKLDLGDLNYQGFFSPAAPGKIIWVWDHPRWTELQPKKWGGPPRRPKFTGRTQDES